jgi:predicted DNA-binding transcriptional regulator YafY
MALFKYASRLQLMNELIQKGSTGNTELFAQKLGISRRQLLYDIQDLKVLGVKIDFDRVRETYCYRNEKSIGNLFRKRIN